MKKLIIASFILASSLIVPKANAQAYVGIKIGIPAPPIPAFLAPPVPQVYGPRVVYSAPVPYYRSEVPNCYERGNAYYREYNRVHYYPAHYHDRWHRDDYDRCRRHYRD